jgi:hypothetical protein
MYISVWRIKFTNSTFGHIAWTFVQLDFDINVYKFKCCKLRTSIKKRARGQIIFMHININQWYLFQAYICKHDICWLFSCILILHSFQFQYFRCECWLTYWKNSKIKTSFEPHIHVVMWDFQRDPSFFPFCSLYLKVYAW